MESSEHAAVTTPFLCLMWKLGFRKETLRGNFRFPLGFVTPDTAEATGSMLAAVRDDKKRSLAVNSVEVCG